MPGRFEVVGPPNGEGRTSITVESIQSGPCPESGWPLRAPSRRRNGANPNGATAHSLGSEFFVTSVDAFQIQLYGSMSRDATFGSWTR